MTGTPGRLQRRPLAGVLFGALLLGPQGAAPVLAQLAAARGSASAPAALPGALPAMGQDPGLIGSALGLSTDLGLSPIPASADLPPALSGAAAPAAALTAPTALAPALAPVGLQAFPRSGTEDVGLPSPAASREAAAKEIGEAVREVSAAREALASEPGVEEAHQAGGRIQEALSPGAARRGAASDLVPVFAGMDAFDSPAGGAGNDEFFARPGGDKTAREHAYYNESPAAPSPPRHGDSETPGWGWRSFALAAAAAALVFLDIHYFGVPLAIKGKILAHGLYMHAAGTLFLLPFAGESSRPFSRWAPVRWVQSLFRSRWVRYLPGAYLGATALFALGEGLAAGSAPLAGMGALAALAGWGLYRFGWKDFSGFPGGPKTLAAYLGAVAALTGLGLALLAPAWAAAPWLLGAAALASAQLLAFLPWRGGPWAPRDWRFYFSLAWAVYPFLGYWIFMALFR